MIFDAPGDPIVDLMEKLIFHWRSIAMGANQRSLIQAPDGFQRDMSHCPTSPRGMGKPLTNPVQGPAAL